MANGLVLAAFAWAAGLVLAAVALPVYGHGESVSSGGGPGVTPSSTSTTLVGVNGLWALAVAAVPTVVTGVVWLALRRCRRRWNLVCSAAIGMLLVFSLAAVLSIGLFAVPVVVLLAAAVGLTPDDRAHVAS